MNKIDEGVCVWCGKEPCVCGTDNHSPKPKPVNTPTK